MLPIIGLCFSALNAGIIVYVVSNINIKLGILMTVCYVVPAAIVIYEAYRQRKQQKQIYDLMFSLEDNIGKELTENKKEWN